MRLFNEFWFQIKSKNTEDETQPQRDAIEEKRAEDGSAEVDNEDNKYREKKGTEKLSNGLAVVVLLFCFGIFGLVLLMDNRLPKPLTLAGNFICQVYLTVTYNQIRLLSDTVVSSLVKFRLFKKATKLMKSSSLFGIYVVNVKSNGSLL